MPRLLCENSRSERDVIKALWKFTELFVCRKVSSEEIKKMRKKFHSRRFKDHIGQKSFWPVHHIHPLSLGGTNEFDNLALVETKLEKLIHVLIDLQNKPVGNRTTEIYIPVLPGKIWTFEKLFTFYPTH